MKGLKLITNGVASFVPYNRSIIAFYEERNRLVARSSKAEQETTTIMVATDEEVREHLLAAVVPSTAGIPTLPQPSGDSADLNKLMSLLISQQNEIAEMRKQLEQKNTPVEDPAPKVEKKTTKSAKQADAETSNLTSKPPVQEVLGAPAINLEKKPISDDDQLANDLQQIL